MDESAPLNMEKDGQGESVDELRQRLNHMKRMMAERQANGMGMEDDGRMKARNGNIIDGSFLSFVFAVALIVILSVSVYAFYHLYHAILKKFPSHHTEL
ncbi:PREDICTED: uncharacterized protein LOC108564234 [Nicrophorus vespilloides]|uniref:Uncharacterized protein LOC108564234 n=1 Tax=Nicrophorus vespilloides TaxID=110193 RepID=A0ABM1MVU5_NICVS|nr:PREDICTED: uncharacterized protein LOC108564234 [Nicrophorus vespilloides]